MKNPISQADIRLLNSQSKHYELRVEAHPQGNVYALFKISKLNKGDKLNE